MAATAAASAAPEVPAAGPPAARAPQVAARAPQVAATAAVSPTRGRPTAPAAGTPTNRRSNSTQARYQVTDHPRRGRGSKEHHDGQATTAQAEEEGLRVLPGADRLRRLQGHRSAPQVHLGPREDPRPPGDRQLH